MLSDPVKKALIDTSRKNSSFVSFGEDLSRRSTIGIGGEAAAWYEPTTVEELCGALVFLRSMNVRTFFLGSGSNTLLPSGFFDAVIVNLCRGEFAKIRFSGDRLAVGAGVKLPFLISEAAEKGIAGFEGLVGIPGTVGGALATNASFKTAISDNLAEVTCVGFGGALRKIRKEEIKFGYREAGFGKRDAIVEAVFRIGRKNPALISEDVRKFFSEKKKAQPLEEKTLGCIFKNPSAGPKSWKLIEEAGFKARRVGGAVVSEKHANFIVNSGRATSRDVRELMRQIQDGVLEKFGVWLEPEIEMVD